MEITKKDIGKDINVKGTYGEVKEVFNNGSILVEFPNKTQDVILKEDLKFCNVLRC